MNCSLRQARAAALESCNNCFAISKEVAVTELARDTSKLGTPIALLGDGASDLGFAGDGVREDAGCC